MPAVLVQQKYAPAPGSPSTTQTVTLDSAPAAGDVIVLIDFEYPSVNGEVTSVSGCGATWTRDVWTGIDLSNFLTFHVSIWVGRNPTGGTAITTTASGALQNELNVSVWRGLTGLLSGSGQVAANTNYFEFSAAPNARGRLVIGAAALNYSETSPVWTDTGVLAPFSDLVGGSDFFPAYAISASGSVNAVHHSPKSTAGVGKFRGLGLAFEVQPVAGQTGLRSRQRMSPSGGAPRSRQVRSRASLRRGPGANP